MVIASMKRRLRRKQARQSLQFIDEKENDKYTIDLYMACTWLCKIWDELEYELIHNSWYFTQVLGRISLKCETKCLDKALVCFLFYRLDFPLSKKANTLAENYRGLSVPFVVLPSPFSN